MLKRALAKSGSCAFLSLLLFAPAAAAQETSSEGGGGAVIAGVIYLAIGAAIAYFMWRNRRPFSIQRQTAVAADQIVTNAVQQYTMNGWAVTSQAPMNATFERRLTGSCLLALPLLLLGILPGLIYLRSRNK